MTHWPELINVPTYLQGTPATALLYGPKIQTAGKIWAALMTPHYLSG